jgi:hypothetical protein
MSIDPGTLSARRRFTRIPDEDSAEPRAGWTP